jgi:hypothetical protein
MLNFIIKALIALIGIPAIILFIFPSVGIFVIPIGMFCLAFYLELALTHPL